MSLTKRIGKVIFWKLHYIKLKAILKRLEEPFDAAIGELEYGSPAVLHAYS